MSKPLSSKACTYNCGAMKPVKQPAAHPHAVAFTVWAALSVPAKNLVLFLSVAAFLSASLSSICLSSGKQNRWYLRPCSK